MRINRRHFARTAATAALVLAAPLALSACGGTYDAAPPPASDGRVTINTGLSAASVAVEMGVKKGYFEQEGLEVRTTTVENPSARVAAVQAGTVDVVELPATTWLKAVSQQVPIHALASENGYPAGKNAARYDNIDVYVGAKSDVTSMGELGKAKIAVPAREDLMEILVTYDIKADGGDPSDVEWIVLDFRSQIDALAAGRVDAIAVPAPLNLLAEGGGARSIARPASGFFEQGPNTLWAVGDRVADDSELAQKLQRAIYKSNAYANKHPAEVIEFAAKKRGLDPSILKNAGVSVYFPTTLDVADMDRMAGKLLDLGFLEDKVDLTGSIIAQPAS